MKREALLKQIDQVRSELQRLIGQKGSLLDPGVIEMSQQLDRLILLTYNQQTKP